MTPEQRAAISARQTGQKRSKEARANMSRAQRNLAPEVAARKSAALSAFRTENPLRMCGDANVNWKGGVRMKEGYRLLLKPDHPNAQKSGYVLEHVFVMSEILGRPLGRGEVVHHKNEIRSDNRPKNLQLMSLSEHTRRHHKGLIKPRSLENLKWNH